MSADMRTLRKLLPLMRLYPWGLPAIVTLGVLASLAEGFGIGLFIPFLQSASGGTFAETGNWLADSLGGLFAAVPPDRRIPIIAGVILASVLAAALLSYANALVFTWLDAHITDRQRTGIFDRLLTMDYGTFERRSAGALLNTLSTETWRTSEALSVAVTLLITAVTLAAYVTLLVLLSPMLTLLVVGAMGLISLAVRAITHRAAAVGRDLTRSDRALSARMVDGVHAMKLIRLFGRQQYERQRFGVASGAVSRSMMKVGFVAETVTPVYQILTAGLVIVILVAALDRAADLATVIVFVLVLSRLQPKVQDFDRARVQLASFGAAVDDVTALLDPGVTYESGGGVQQIDLGGGIRFERVTFRYDANDDPALHETSFRIPAGRTTALVGPSGAGKSTVIRLLLRLQEPDSGAIRIGRQRLSSLDVHEWRRRIAVVSQDAYMFNATIRENIAYGRLDATDDEIEAAARAANAHDFVRALPRGYDTEVGERGVRLSGGQQQRIALARAIIRDPEILILDEATNALDSLAEQVIEDSLRALAGDRTIVIVAHRLATIREADHVVVLAGGRTLEQGTVPELIERDGLFRRLYRLQSLTVASESRAGMP